MTDRMLDRYLDQQDEWIERNADDLAVLRIASELKWQLYQNACEDNMRNGTVIPPADMPEFAAAIEAEGVYMHAADLYHGNI